MNWRDFMSSTCSPTLFILLLHFLLICETVLFLSLCCSSSLSLLPFTVSLSFLRISPPAAPVTQTPEKQLETWRPSTKWRIWAWLWTRSGTQIMFWPLKWLWKIRWVQDANPNVMHKVFKRLDNALFCLVSV